MTRYVTELVGTFFLVLTIGLCAVAPGGPAPMAPLAIGAALMVMVYMGGHVSGGHYNPAVSLGVLLRRKLAPGDFVAYVAAQLIGALLAALVVHLVRGPGFTVAPAPTSSAAASLLVEFLFSFALVLVVLNVAVARKTAGNSYYGLAIGFTVAVGAFAAGDVSGGAFNPAVGLMPTLYHAAIASGAWQHVWIYLVGPLLGAVVATGVFHLQEAREG